MIDLNELTEEIILYAIEVHRELRPGLLESAYRDCLAYELSKLNLSFQLVEPVPVKYKSIIKVLKDIFY